MSATRTETSLPRFAFGKNWSRFLRTITNERIAAAEKSLTAVFGEDGLRGKRFLDIGCGSGLFSLAAYRLGAEVTSFDYDADSVACAEELRRREQAESQRWKIERGSVLDAGYLEGLGVFEVVYSWGVLHHTGDMWTAVALASKRVKPGGLFWIAIYNDQGALSRVWRCVKATYVRLPRWLQLPYVAVVGSLWGFQRLVRRAFRIIGGALPGPSAPARRDGAQRLRGMHLWYDLVDWIGGYPFEVAKPEDVFRFLRDRGFQLTEMSTCGGDLGCNEFVFQRTMA